MLTRVYESEVGGTHIASPMIAVHTWRPAGAPSVASTVSGCASVRTASERCPDRSVAGAGRERASLTDVNLALGRLLPDRFR